MAEQTKIRLYKYVTPPKSSGATISVGNKTIQGDSFSTTIKAVNSLGATVNSIAIALNKQAKANARIQKDQARKAGLARDRAREANIERKGSTTTKGVAQASKAAGGFFDGLLGALGKLAIFSALKWLGDPKNTKRIKDTFEKLKKFWNWTVETVTNITNWVKETWESIFGKDKTMEERLKGAGKLALAAAGALAALSFLKNPIRTIKNFTSLIGLIGKGIINAGKFFGGNVAGQAIMSGAQGVMAYQDVMENYDGLEEDRVAAARGAGIGAAVGAQGLAMLGNKIAGPLGGMIGSALGGFLGKEAGKFLGPIVGDFFNTLKDIFGKVMGFLEKMFAPLGEAIQTLFKEMGPVIDKVVDFIKPHLPVLKSAAEFIGKIAMAPLIGMIKGLTAVLQFISGGAGADVAGAALDAVTGAAPAAAAEQTPGGGKPNPATSGDLASFIGAVESGNDYTKLVGGKQDKSILSKTVSQLNAERGGQFAMGRYQIQMRTASEVLRNAGKDPTQFKFDQAGQDYIYKLLLKRRGLDDYMSGQMSKETFARNLSMEWAALPRGSDNLSYYHGDGTNKAHRGWQETLGTLEKLKGRSKGGWIHGPQSGYPVSLDGKNISFIGHGTEYVAQRSAGGFVIPFDTPDTRRDPGLTSRRLSEAQSGGYLKSIGGLIPKTALGLLGGGPGGAVFGGLVNSFMGSVTERIGQRMSTAIPTPTLQTSSPKTGEDLASILARIKNLSQSAQNGDFENAVKTMVAEAIKLPVEQQGGGGTQMPIPLSAKENPATSFLASRFGRVAEQSNLFSNFI